MWVCAGVSCGCRQRECRPAKESGKAMWVAGEMEMVGQTKRKVVALLSLGGRETSYLRGFGVTSIGPLDFKFGGVVVAASSSSTVAFLDSPEERLRY
ncbi:hypothetical protein GH714_017559 [Hevea brasiliensis]|uniref:Uncharacterized protein n=1 Tax=Hevea brasiliensis TaxID=3981 RepID=A0A6A6NDE1_HEVBR|nr:hypothetical protein GH714_017559 [Hevea brasiliensis]